MEVQTRSHNGEIRRFKTLLEAFLYADTEYNVWKISFNAEDGSRVRLVERFDEQQGDRCWRFEPLDVAYPSGLDWDHENDNAGDRSHKIPSGKTELVPKG